jgi:hypothetical protein
MRNHPKKEPKEGNFVCHFCENKNCERKYRKERKMNLQEKI